ncbi:UDP-N-acetylmuramoyl-tripeptide--D-alanyl-D-alanine ligase [Metabacillus fastidiosus]|uniref:UDP-N-acetylmuramoyl-tripeptide--D-alanyl-D- alanine ligase n=1 Tax=Metabacillus fastidiosus TaxID=1458 RepID=UPI002E1F558D|nr:UDP-N-acetylmuramoyl-tripeptide--D-alanyl-D-alanine ligase [Metabacillus fastidiosus]
MIKRSLKEIHKMISGSHLQSGDESIHINGISTDTRQIQENNLYIPLVGENFNGHTFAEKAIELGAAAIIWDKNEPNPPQNVPVLFVDNTLGALQGLAKSYRDELNIKVVGITGSNGKTTTKDMISSVLATTYKIHKTKGNLNNHIGLPLTILSMPEETEIAILEMGMSGKGEIELLSAIGRPDVAVITNIGEAHLMDLGSREGIAEAKLEITKGLKEDGTLIYYGDEPLLKEGVKDLSIRTVTFGETAENDYFATGINQKINGTSFVVAGNEYFIPVLGKHNVNNALAAFAVGKYFSIDEQNMATGLNKIEITGMRLELVQAENNVSVINDAYNASPTSMNAAIQLLEDLQGFNKKIVVLGDMLELGEDEKLFHQQVGEKINEKEIAYVYAYGKLGEEIAAGAKKNIPGERVLHFHDKEELIADLKKKLASGDIVLVKASRGMRLEQVVESIL